MNNKGGLFLIIGMAFLVVILLPIVFMQIYSISRPLFQVIIAFVIMGYLKNLGIEGVIYWILSAILIYFLAWKYIELSASVYVLMFLMGAGFTSTLIWGSAFFKGLFTKPKKPSMGGE